MNAYIIKYLLLVLTAPLWLPFAKALWEEFNDAMREDGGLWGDDPSAVERERIRAEIANEPPRLLNEPIAHARSHAGDGQATAGPGRARRGF